MRNQTTLPKVVAVCLLSLASVFSSSLARADSTSRGVNGINVPAGLNGSGITIGQVEGGRPAQPGFDTLAANANVTPGQVWNGFALPVANNLWELGETVAPIPPFNQNHAQNVASVMISTAGTHQGIAPGARLVASASSPPNSGTFNFLSAKSAIADQQLHLREPVAAVNMSFGIGQLPAADGSILLSQYVDWASDKFDSLYVVAADEQGPPAPGSPSDSFNGINVAMSRQVGGVFRQVDPGNIFTSNGSRRMNDILAPGRSITMDSYGGGTNVSSGTSFAAPHVTGTVALLHQYANQRVAANDPEFTGFPKRHEVHKAVLMNSVDKIKDDGTFNFNGNAVPQGYLLGMEKTIIDTNSLDWTASDAFSNVFQPLDDQMGVGQLNASRALTQFAAGEWDPGFVPGIGWDFGITVGAGDTSTYNIQNRLQEDSFFSATLAWDRVVNLNDSLVNNGLFDAEIWQDTGIPGSANAANPGLLGAGSGAVTWFDFGADSTPGTADQGENDGLINFGESSEPFLDVNGDGQYAFATETFTTAGLTDLDLYLLPRGETDFSKAIGSSISVVDSVEHVFFQIPDTGFYDLVVRQPFAGIESTQDYGLAWWGVIPEPSSAVLVLAMLSGLCGRRFPAQQRYRS